MDKFTIGYVTWKNNAILTETLDSHVKNGLLENIHQSNRYIFFQELKQQDYSFASKYKCRCVGDKKNVGILHAFIKLVESCGTDYFIFCENDFVLLDNYPDYDIKKCLEDVKSILDENPNAQVKLSNPKNPGFVYCRPENIKEWLKSSRNDFPYKLESLSWVPDPENFYKNNISVINKNYKWYKVNSDGQLWSNHIYACKTEFLKTVIIPILKFNISNNKNLDVRYQGLEDTLINFRTLKGINPTIDPLISRLESRTVFSGGGNFYHNKK